MLLSLSLSLSLLGTPTLAQNGSTECLAGCDQWFDGCNNCRCNVDGTMGACTKKACVTTTVEPYCRDCAVDSTCQSSAWCYQSVCIPFQTVDEGCEGFTYHPQKCSPLLECVHEKQTPPIIADLSGVCTCDPVCCEAMTAECLACQECTDVDTYCAKHPGEVDCECSPICCLAMTAGCLACQECTDVDTYCATNAHVAGCEALVDPSTPCSPCEIFDGEWICMAIDCAPLGCDEDWCHQCPTARPYAYTNDGDCCPSCHSVPSCSGCCPENARCFAPDPPCCAKRENCYTREVWSEEKKKWCCDNKHIGCPPMVPPTTDGKDDPAEGRPGQGVLWGLVIVGAVAVFLVSCVPGT
jgi:hypothetical protein